MITATRFNAIHLARCLAFVLLSLSAPPTWAKPAAEVTIRSNPPGALVYIDGRQNGVSGNTPLKLRLSRGPHKITLDLAGYQSIERTIRVTHSDSFHFKLSSLVGRAGSFDGTPGVGMLDIRSRWSHAQVYIDGRPFGATPQIVRGVPAGEHRVEIHSDDPSVPPWRKSVMVLDGQTVQVEQAAAPPAEVAFLARNPAVPYQIAIGTATCITPCKLTIPSGPVNVAVAGPRTFNKELILPAGPSRVTVQHLTLSRVIAGSILTGLSIPFLTAGSEFVIWGEDDDILWDDATVVGSLLVAHGIAFFVAGVVELALIKTNKLALVPMPGFALGPRGGNLTLGWSF